MKKVIIAAIFLIVASPAFALTGISIGIKGGLALQPDFPIADRAGADTDQMTLIGGQFKFSRLPMIDIIGTVEYAWKTYDYTILGEPAEFEIRNLAASVSIVYPLKMRMLKPFVGGGIGMNNVSYEASVPGGLSLTLPEDEAHFGYHVLGGFNLSFPTAPVSFTAEGRYNIINTSGENSTYFQVTGSINFHFM